MVKKETKKKKQVKKKTKKKKAVTKKQPVVAAKKKKEKVAKKGKARYIEAVGRRKTATARVRFWPQRTKKDFLVNGRPYQEYFPTFELQRTVTAALQKMNCLDKFRIEVLAKGGGLQAQAEAIRHGTARALVLFNSDFRKKLKKAGFLTRDPRMRERKKFGLKRARRAPQWQKR